MSYGVNQHVMKTARAVRTRLLRVRPAPVLDNTRLGGACGLAALELALRLNMPESMCCNTMHAWNEVFEHVVDVTATQYNPRFRRPILEAVHVVKAPSALEFYRSPVRGLVALRTFRRWYENPTRPTFAHVWHVQWTQLTDRWASRLSVWDSSWKELR